MRRAVQKIAPPTRVREPVMDQARRPLGVSATSLVGVVPPTSGGTGTATVQPQNRVIVAGAAGIYTSHADFIFDLATGRLGLRTNAPGVTFDLLDNTINGNLVVHGRLRNDTAASGGQPRQLSPALLFAGAGATAGGVSSVAQRICLYESPALRDGSDPDIEGGGDEPVLGIAGDRDGAGLVEVIRLGKANATDGFIMLQNVNAGAQYRLRGSNATGRYYFLSCADASAALTFGISEGDTAAAIRFTTDGTNRVRFGGISFTTTIEFAAGAGKVIFNPTDAGGAGLVQFGRRVTDDSPGVGAQVQFWPVTGQTTPAAAVMEPGGALYRTRLEANGDLQFVVTASKVYWAGRARIFSPADGVVELTDAAETSFGRLQLGGTSSSFPAIKRASAVLEVRLADDSAYAELRALRAGVDAGERFGFAGRSRITSPADGQILLTDDAAATFARLMLGGTSSSFPAVKRNAAVLEVKLADDSDFAELKAKVLRISDGAFMIRSAAAMTDGAGASAGTLTNAPAAGNPTKWIPYDDNGTTRFIPSW